MRTLITVGMILDVSEDQLMEIVELMENTLTLQVAAVLERHDADWDDLAATGMDLYGVTATPIRDMRPLRRNA